MDDVRYYEDKDFEMVKGWYEKRGLRLDDRNVLPGVGFIVDNVGAGFIYLTDSSIAFIEGYITNKDADRGTRDMALDVISECLIAHAIVAGYKYIKCETKKAAIVGRAKRFGFKVLGETVSLMKEV